MASAFGKAPQGERLERMSASPRFVDGTFRNTLPTGTPGASKREGSPVAAMGEFFFGGKERIPPAPLPSLDPRPAWLRPAETGLRATWLGHSTVLLELDGVRVLTDPVWGERASPYGFAGPKRFQPVPVSIAALPKLDAIIVSHDHYDHLDFPSIALLAKLDVPFYTSLGVGAHLEAWGVRPERIVEMDWWDAQRIPGTELQITAAPAQHFSGRGFRRNATLWSSFALRSPNHHVFFSGDTGLTPEYGEIARRLGRFELVMLEVGAFHPSWGDIHLGPENALEALALLGGGSLLPVHWGTFNLAVHAWDDPAETLVRLAGPRGVNLVMPRLGDAIEPARVDTVEPWWRGLRKAAPEPRATSDEPVAEAPLGPPID